MIVAVFFPSLMGVGIIISGALLISDWLRRLFPKSNLRRRHNVVVGTYGAVGNAVEAAGYRVDEPWFIHRGKRLRSTYVLLAVACAVSAAGCVWTADELFEDALGLFFESPWVIGIGYGVAAALLTLAFVFLTMAVLYQSMPPLLRRFVEDTPAGRIVLPTGEDHTAAIDNIAKET